MKKLSLALVAILGVLCPLQSQYTSVRYDVSSNWFNQGQPLPSETDLIFTGTIPDDIDMMELSFLDAKREDVLYTAAWRRTSTDVEFSLPVNYKLRSDFMYDIRIDYYKPASKMQLQKLREQLETVLNSYLSVNLKEGNTIELKRSANKTVEEMEELVQQYLASYRATTGNWETSLSENVLLKLRQMEQAKLTRSFDKQDSLQNKDQVRVDARSEQMVEFRQILSDDLDRIFDVELLRNNDSRMIDNYATERKPNVLALNLGYGGVYLSGKWTDGTYGSAPYAGIALPLGNRVLGTKFFRNASLTLGVFLDQLDSGDDQQVKGFLIDQPLYIGLDYRLFQFVHLNAGTTLLDGSTLQSGEGSSTNQQLAFRPFIGLSVRIDLRLGLGK